MTATYELRRMLDERGVEYETFSGAFATKTCWPCANGLTAIFVEYDGGTTRFEMSRWHVAPEQAIAATLGAGTCHMDVLNTGDCAGYECSEYIMHCNGCGHEFGHVLYNEDGDVWMSEPPNYCPNCGRMVVDE